MRVLAIVACLLGVPASLAALPFPQVPVGTPNPSFGLKENPGKVTHYVNNANLLATDTSNPAGTALRPRRTVPTTLPAGAVVEVRGGPYTVGSVTWIGNGTAAAPVFIKGVGSPVFQGPWGARIIVVGAYLVIDGLSLKNVAVNMAPAVHHFALRHSKITEYSPGTHSSAVAISGKDIVIADNEISYNGDANAPTEIDIAGVFVMPGATRVWILSNRIHHNGGDGVLVGSADSPEPWASFVYVGGNELHDDRENGVDIKRARDVIVSQNLVYGYVARSSSSGESIVSHYMPERVWILNNVVARSHQGIVSTGSSGYFVAGNLIVGIQHAAGTAYDPMSLWGASGILTYNTSSSAHVNNTVWWSDSGINIASGGATEVVNNIVGGLTQASGAIRFGSNALRTSSTVTNNLTTGNPIFVNPNILDFRLGSTSQAVNSGVAHWIYNAFQSYYGLSLNRDLYGGVRAVGSAYDIGAVEFQY